MCLLVYLLFILFRFYIYTDKNESTSSMQFYCCKCSHNIAILRKEPIVEEAEDDVLQDIQPQAEQYEGQQDGRRIREYFARNFFLMKSTVYANVCKIMNKYTLK